jgi:hypothetical protein
MFNNIVSGRLQSSTHSSNSNAFNNIFAIVFNRVAHSSINTAFNIVISIAFNNTVPNRWPAPTLTARVAAWFQSSIHSTSASRLTTSFPIVGPLQYQHRVQQHRFQSLIHSSVSIAFNNTVPNCSSASTLTQQQRIQQHLCNHV